VEKIGFCSFTGLFHANPNDWVKKALPLTGRERQVIAMVGFLQVNKPISGFGEARRSAGV